MTVLLLLAYQVADVGSLNGTMLNGIPISIAGRQRGAAHRLDNDALLQLGSTVIKVIIGCTWPLVYCNAACG